MGDRGRGGGGYSSCFHVGEYLGCSGQYVSFSGWAVLSSHGVYPYMVQYRVRGTAAAAMGAAGRVGAALGARWVLQPGDLHNPSVR